MKYKTKKENRLKLYFSTLGNKMKTTLKKVGDLKHLRIQRNYQEMKIENWCRFLQIY